MLIITHSHKFNIFFTFLLRKPAFTGSKTKLCILLFSETMETYEDLSPEPMMTQTVEFSSSEQPGDLEPSSSATVQTISLETEPNSQVPATSSSPTLEASMEVEPPESPMLEVADSEYVDGMEEEEVTQPIVDDAVAGDVEESPGVVGATSLVNCSSRR